MAREISALPVNQALGKMFEKFPNTADQLIPLLQHAQGELGYLSEEAMFGIADYLKLPASHIYGVATFYSQFRFKPLGKNRITCCRGTACHVRGGKKVIEEITKELNVVDGETTEDLEFSLETVACIGSCALAPVLVINQKIYGKVTPKRIKQVLDEMRGIAPATAKEDEAPEKKGPEPADKKAPAPEPAAAAPASVPMPVKEEPKAKAAKPAKKAAKKPAAKAKAAKPVKKTAKKPATKTKAAKPGKKTVKQQAPKRAAKKRAVKVGKKKGK